MESRFKDQGLGDMMWVHMSKASLLVELEAWPTVEVAMRRRTPPTRSEPMVLMVVVAMNAGAIRRETSVIGACAKRNDAKAVDT